MFITKAVPGWYQRINTSNVKRPDMMTYKAFCQANEARLKTLYPFLTQKQIKGKLFQQWKKSQPSDTNLKMKRRSTIVKSKKKHPVVQSASLEIHPKSDTSKRVQTPSLRGSHTSSRNKWLQNEQKAKMPGHENNSKPFILCAKAPEVTHSICKTEQRFIKRESITAMTSSTTSVTNQVTFSQSDFTKGDRSSNPKDRHLSSLRNTEELSPAIRNTLLGNLPISAKQNVKFHTEVRKRTGGLESEAGFDSSSPEFCSVRTGKFKDREKKFCLFEDEFPLDFSKSKKRMKTKTKIDTKMITSSKRATGNTSKSVKSDGHSYNRRNRHTRNDSSNSGQKSASQLKKISVSFPATTLEKPSRIAERDLGKKPLNAQNIKKENKICFESSCEKLLQLGCSKMSKPDNKGFRSSPPLSLLSLVSSDDQAVISENVDKPVQTCEVSATDCNSRAVTSDNSSNMYAVQFDRNENKTSKSSSVKGRNAKQLLSGKQTLTHFDNMSVSKTKRRSNSKISCMVMNTCISNENDSTYDDNKDSKNNAQCILKHQPQSDLTDVSMVTCESKNTQSPFSCSGSQKKMLSVAGPSKMSSKEVEMDGSNILLKIINQLKPARTSYHSLVHPESFEFSKDLIQPHSSMTHMTTEPVHGDEFPPQNQIQAKTTEQRACRKRGNILCNMFEEVGTLTKARRYISSEDGALLPELDDGGFM